MGVNRVKTISFKNLFKSMFFLAVANIGKIFVHIPMLETLSIERILISMRNIAE